MKNIKELGLELIELEDQVLLVDELEHTKDRLILHQSINGKVNHFYKGDEIDLDNYNSRRFLGLTFNVVASTKQLEGLPLLVIKNGIKKLATKTLSEQDWDTSKGLPFNEGYLKGFKEGYNNAKSTYKFTEEDMIEFVVWLNNTDEIFEQTKHIDFTKSDKDVGKELLEIWKEQRAKKELWVETVDYCRLPYTTDKCPCQNCKGEGLLKITNNQIKAIWK